jgi:hypothetical protein
LKNARSRFQSAEVAGGSGTTVPGVETRFPEEFAAIYKTRSGLAHGEVMLMADLRPWQFFGDTLQQWQAKFQRNTYRIIATALRNWVLAAPTAAK